MALAFAAAVTLRYLRYLFIEGLCYSPVNRTGSPQGFSSIQILHLSDSNFPQGVKQKGRKVIEKDKTKEEKPLQSVESGQSHDGAPGHWVYRKGTGGTFTERMVVSD